MVDLDRIHQRLQLLTGYLHELRRLLVRDLPVAKYLQYEVYTGRYLVQVAALTRRFTLTRLPPGGRG